MSDQSGVFGSDMPKLPTAKFDAAGDNHLGTVTSVNQVQQKSFVRGKPGAGELLFWGPTGGAPVKLSQVDKAIFALYKPVWQLAIELDNEKVIWAHGDMLKEVKKAVKAAGAFEIAIGSQLGVMLSELKDTGGDNLKKVFKAKYVHPAG